MVHRDPYPSNRMTICRKQTKYIPIWLPHGHKSIPIQSRTTYENLPGSGMITDRRFKVEEKIHQVTDELVGSLSATVDYIQHPQNIKHLYHSSITWQNIHKQIRVIKDTRRPSHGRAIVSDTDSQAWVSNIWSYDEIHFCHIGHEGPKIRITCCNFSEQLRDNMICSSCG